MSLRFLTTLVVFGLATTSLPAQAAPPAHPVFLPGNTAEGNLPTARLQALH